MPTRQLPLLPNCACRSRDTADLDNAGSLCAASVRSRRAARASWHIYAVCGFCRAAARATSPDLLSLRVSKRTRSNSSQVRLICCMSPYRGKESPAGYKALRHLAWRRVELRRASTIWRRPCKSFSPSLDAELARRKRPPHSVEIAFGRWELASVEKLRIDPAAPRPHNHEEYKWRVWELALAMRQRQRSYSTMSS